jgi:hypothetical protein
VLPRMVDSGLFALPARSHAHECLVQAMDLYASPMLSEPALPVHKIFLALRRSDLPVLDLLGLCGGPTEALEALSPDRVADIIGAYLAAQSQRCAFKEIAVSSSHVASPRALDLLHTIISLATQSDELTALTLRGGSASAYLISAAHVCKIAKCINGLSVLRLPGLPNVNDSNISLLLDAAGAALTELDISMTGITTSGLSRALTRPVGSMQPHIRDSLRFLDLTATSIDETALFCLIGLSALEELRIGWTPVVRPAAHGRGSASDDIVELTNMLGSAISTYSMPRLKRLDVSGLTVDLSGALRAAASLEQISLVGANLDDFGPSFLANLPTNLRIIDMTQVTGRSLNAATLIARNGASPLALLRVLNLSGSLVAGILAGRTDSDSEHIDWENNALTAAFRSLSELRELDVSDTSHLSSNAIVAVLSGCCGRLEILRLRKVRRPNLATAFNKRLRSTSTLLSFPDLRELDFSDSSFGNEVNGAISAFLTYAREVSTICLAGTSCVNDDVLGVLELFTSYSIAKLDVSRTAVRSAGLNAWKRPMPNLQVLDFRECSLVDKESVVRFCRRAPALDTVLTSFDIATLGVGRASIRARQAIQLVKEANDKIFIPEWRRRSRPSF